MKVSNDGKIPPKKPRPKKESKISPSEHKSSFSVTCHTGYISTFILLISTLLIYDLIVLSSETVNFEALKTDLKTSVYNQGDPVRIIIESLDKIQSRDQILDVINFIGGTGVGKTFTANILKKHFYPFTYDIRGSLHLQGAHQQILHKIKHNNYKYNLIIIDDLTISDFDNLFIFIKSLSQDNVALVICIFNIQETDNDLNHKINYDHINKIIESFSMAEIPHKVAKFQEFTDDQVSGWVIKQLNMRGIDQQLHSRIVNSVVKNQNVRYNGLKGLISKISLEL